MLQSLGIPIHQAFGCSIDVIGFPSAIPGYGPYDGQGAMIGSFHMPGKGFGEQDGREAVDLQCFFA